MAHLELRSVTVERGGIAVVSDIDLVLASGSITAVVGASGSGKTSLLRAIAGLDPLTTGRVHFDGVDMTDVEAAHRDVAFAFQDPALYPGRNVRRNLSFPLEIRREYVEEIRKRVGAEARALHIEDLLTRRPSELSAGEAHMVEIARALIRAPSVLLLDEPFAHLDPNRATMMRRELLFLHRGFGITTIVTTNDPRDAMAMPDLLVVMERGRIVQAAAPLDVYHQPSTAAAAHLTGDAAVLDIRVTTDVDGAWLVHSAFRVRAWQPALRAHADRRLQMIVRPDWWVLDDAGSIRGTIESIDRTNRTASVSCETGDRSIEISLGDDAPRRNNLRVGSPIGLRLDHFVLLDPIDGCRIRLN